MSYLCNALRAIHDKSIDPFKSAFQQAINDIERVYIAGTLTFIREHHRDLREKIMEVENKMDKVWQAGLRGEESFEKFEEELTKWRDLHHQAIKIFRVGQGKGQELLIKEGVDTDPRQTSMIF